MKNATQLAVALVAATLAGQRALRAEPLDLTTTTGKARVTAISPTVFRIHVGPTSEPVDSVYLDPHLKPGDVGKASEVEGHRRLTTDAGSIDVDPTTGTWSLLDAKGAVLVPPAPLLASTASAEGKTWLQLDVGWPRERKFEVYGCGNGADALVQTQVASRVGNGVAVVPYFWSKAGFASFVVGADENAPATCDGQDKGGAVSWSVPGAQADLYVILAPTLADSTREYLTLTGKPPVPPKWTFGYLQSRWGWKDKAYIDDALAQFQQRKLPVDAFIFDFEWYTTYPDYNVKPEGVPDFSDFGWNDRLFPDPAAQIKAMHDAGVHFVGIRKPRLGNSDALKFARGKGWGFQGQGNDHFDARGLWFASPEARGWYADKIYPLLKAGVDGWWNDEGEFTFTNYSYWNQAEQLALSMSNEKARLWTLNRSFQPGTSRYGAAAWSGDIGAKWKDLERTPATLLNWGLAGMPDCGCDIGGFFGEDTPELLTRWMQAGTFFPVMRAHSDVSVTPHFPWLFGEKAEAAIRKTLDYRYMMVPYLYSLAHEAHESGMPVMRPLALVFPDDPRVANLSSEWMVGDNLLVAPILTPENHREIYLPAGKWYEFGRPSPIDGGAEVERDVPLDRTPVFFRAGSVVPCATPGALHTRDLADGPLQLHVFPGRDATFTLVEDDGATTGYLSGDVRRTTFTWTDATRTLSWARTGTYDGDNCFKSVRIAPIDVEVDDASLPLTAKGSVAFPK